MPAPRVLVGTAAWALPRVHRRRFPAAGSNLERYAARLNCTEINSSFYRPHKPATYDHWAASVPKDFRFSVKMPQLITHELRLARVGKPLDAFLESVAPLGRKLGCLLVQLPPSLAFERPVVAKFLKVLRARHGGAVAIEPRHASWFTPAAEALLVESRIARVAADPPRAEADSAPGGWPGIAYYRLHGSPVIYRSSYDSKYLATLARQMNAHRTSGAEAWCIFDNTMLGAAAANALALSKRIR